jgi:iron uptake system component EfeO
MTTAAPGRVAALSSLALSLALAVAACSGDKGGGSGGGGSARTVDVALTDAGCEPAKLDLPAGAVTFKVTNKGTDKVSEFEILDGDRILGEVENVAAGLERSFSLNLTAGSYAMKCPGGASAPEGTLTVSGDRAAGGGGDADLVAAATRYRGYLSDQAGLLVRSTKTFVDAVLHGNVAAAKRAYGLARVPYERIEPVAESFGELDPRIDARAGDVPPAQWRGFHRIEQALWVDNSTRGMAPVARGLLADVSDLQRKVGTVKLDASQIANGANELLGEVSSSKITGEEERYSHTDLLDFKANLDGARAAFDAVRPALDKRDANLASQIDGRFQAADRTLAAYRSGSGYLPYNRLTDADTRKLAQAIDALAEPLSTVSAKLAGS